MTSRELTDDLFSRLLSTIEDGSATAIDPPQQWSGGSAQGFQFAGSSDQGVYEVIGRGFVYYRGDVAVGFTDYYDFGGPLSFIQMAGVRQGARIFLTTYGEFECGENRCGDFVDDTR